MGRQDERPPYLFLEMGSGVPRGQQGHLEEEDSSLPPWRFSHRQPEGFPLVPGDHRSMVCSAACVPIAQTGSRLPERLSPRAGAGVLVWHFLNKTPGFWRGVPRGISGLDIETPQGLCSRLCPGFREALQLTPQPGLVSPTSQAPLPRPIGLSAGQGVEDPFPPLVLRSGGAASPRSPLPGHFTFAGLTQAPAPYLGGLKPRPRRARRAPQRPEPQCMVRPGGGATVGMEPGQPRLGARLLQKRQVQILKNTAS